MNIPSNAQRVWASTHTTGYILPDGQAWEHFNGQGTTLKSSTKYWEHIAECPRDWAGPIRSVWEEVHSGAYDSSQGLRPHGVFIDADGDISVSYPGGPGWIEWDRKVRHG